MRGAHRALPLVRFPPQRRCLLRREHRDSYHSYFPGAKPYPRCIHRPGVARKPDDRGADRLAPSQKSYRLDLVWRGLALPDTALHAGLRRLRPGREFGLALGRVPSLVLDVDRVRWTDPGGSVPDAAVPRWPSTVSSLANRGMGGGLRSRVGSACRRLLSGTSDHPRLRRKPARSHGCNWERINSLWLPRGVEAY